MPKPVIKNFCFDFGVRVDDKLTEDGRGRLYVPKQLIVDGYDGPALRTFMEETAVAWLEQVAPHRLNYGADDR